jgi:hypothetical protein
MPNISRFHLTNYNAYDAHCDPVPGKWRVSV